MNTLQHFSYPTFIEPIRKLNSNIFIYYDNIKDEMYINLLKKKLHNYKLIIYEPNNINLSDINYKLKNCFVSINIKCKNTKLTMYIRLNGLPVINDNCTDIDLILRKIKYFEKIKDKSNQ